MNLHLTLNPIEPAPLSIKHSQGLGLDLSLLLKNLAGELINAAIGFLGGYYGAQAGGVLLPDAPHVVNLDGKASIGALHALTDHRLLEYLATAGIDRLFLRDYQVPWFDSVYPQWRRQFSSVVSADRAAIFAREGAAAETARNP